MQKHCLIIGMGPGLSLAVAQRFAAEGFAIGAIGRNGDKLQTYGSQLAGVAYHASQADAGDESQLQQAIQSCQAELGPVSVLVYNAAYWRDAAVAELSPAELRTAFGVSTVGALIAVQEVLPAMRAAGRGTLLLTGGCLALYPAPRMAALSIGKTAIRHLALTLAKELRPEGIHAATVTVCGGIQPGTYFDPAKIAEVYWQLHQEEPAQFRAEVVYSERKLTPELGELYQTSLT